MSLAAWRPTPRKSGSHRVFGQVIVYLSDTLAKRALAPCAASGRAEPALVLQDDLTG